jgi:type IV fimbrial biogenesis protein FimT
MKNKSGFTLVELMVTLAVGAIILTIGVPALNSMMSSNRAAGNANDLVNALRLARSEAVKRGEGVTVCASDANNAVCSGADWQNGWLVFTDPDNDRVYAAADDTLIRVWQAPEGGMTFDGSTPNTIRFLSSGELSGAEIDFAFKMSDCVGNQARTLSISRMGRTEINSSTCF